VGSWFLQASSNLADGPDDRLLDKEAAYRSTMQDHQTWTTEELENPLIGETGSYIIPGLG
jgi:hypothetical protein